MSPNIMADFRLLIGTQLVEPGANPITDLLVVKVLVDRYVFRGVSEEGLVQGFSVCLWGV
jgi:hypothetical protein